MSVVAGRLCIGTSGFASPSLRACLPATSGAAMDVLAAYATRFDAVEMESAFSRPPSEATVEAWRDATREEFTFSVCVPRLATHTHLLGAPEDVAAFSRSLQGLGSRLGCLLFTTPPQLERDVGRLSSVLQAVPDGVSTAWEFRDESWRCSEVYDLLYEHGSAEVVVDNSDGPPPRMRHWDAPFLYVRFRKDRYRPSDLLAWSDLLAESSSGRPIFAFFRPCTEAVAYATALSELLVEALEPQTVG